MDPRPLPIDMNPAELREAQLAGRSIVLLDCREVWEHEIVHLPDAILIPLGELHERLGEVPRSGEVVVYCHHGIRSRHAAAHLRQAGIGTARSLAGGIDAWAASIDTSLARY